MTDENRRQNAARELERAEVCRAEARALVGAGLPYGAASRAYYVVFHAARALLFSIGIEVKTHAGLAAMVGEHFVRPGRMPVELGRLVSRMQRDREDADYTLGAVFTSDEAHRMIADAELFVNEVRRLAGAAGSPSGPASN